MKTLHEAAAKALAVLDSFALHTPEIISGPDYETATELRSALKRSAQQVAVPLTDAEIYAVARHHPRIATLVPHLEVGQFARAIEKHHGIGAKP